MCVSLTVTTWIWLLNAVIFAVPPRHQHDLIVSLLCVFLALYECGIWRPDSAGDGNG